VNEMHSRVKELRNPFACDGDQRFDAKVKCNWEGLILGLPPKEQNRAKLQGGMGSFGIDWYITQ